MNPIEDFQQLKARLRDAAVRPRASLGQNFLMSPSLLAAIVKHAKISPGERVLEVGTGTGSLTRHLLAAGATVLGIEIDRALSIITRDNCSDYPDTVEILHCDVIEKGKHLSTEVAGRLRQFNAEGGYKLVANLPYNISTSLFIEIMQRSVRPDMAVLLVQAEFAQRLCATPGTHDFSPVSVMARLFGTARIVREVSKEMFWPTPNVSSSVIVWEASAIQPVYADEEMLFKIISVLFAHRRKTVASALRQSAKRGYDGLRIDLMAALAESGVDGKKRAEQMECSDFVAIYQSAIKQI